MEIVNQTLLIILVLFAVYTDIRYRKIHNALTFPAVLYGLAISFFYGPEVFTASLKGFGLGLVCLLPFFLLGGIGGGDVKLLAAIGAVGGYPFILRAIVYMAFLGGVMAFLALVWKKSARESIGDLSGLVMTLAIFFKHPAASPDPPDGDMKLTIPYGVAIGAGSLMAVFIKF